MKRRVVSSLVLLSFLTWLLASILWLRSYNGGDVLWGPAGPRGDRALWSKHGRVGYWYNPASEFSSATPSDWLEWDWGDLGGISFESMSEPWTMWSGKGFGFVLPWWPIFVATAVFPALWVRRFGFPDWFCSAMCNVPKLLAALWPATVALVVQWYRFGEASFAIYFCAVLVAFPIAAALGLIAQRAKPWPWQFRRRRAQRRKARGLCPDCGYDLRASAERCPECGHVRRLLSTPRNANAQAASA
jgi:hypothetical protein